MRAWAATAGKLLLAALIFLATTEGALRLYHHYRPWFIFSTDTAQRFRGRPGEEFYGFPHNSSGFFDIEYPHAKPEGVFRIAAIGDSFVHGVVPYEQNFLTLLDEKLGPGVEVMNMGVPGAGPPEYATLLEESFAWKPDMAVVFFFVGNDIILYLKESKAPKEPALYIQTVFGYLSSLVLKTHATNILDREYDDDAPMYTIEEYDYLVNVNLTKYVRRKADGRTFISTNYELLNNYEYNTRTIAQMKQLCDARGVGFLAVLVPEEVQVSQALMLRALTQAFSDGKNADVELVFDLPNRMLADDFLTYGVGYLDLLDTFEREERRTGKRLYRPRDTHWNMAGNALAADALHTAFMEQPGLRKSLAEGRSARP